MRVYQCVMWDVTGAPRGSQCAMWDVTGAPWGRQCAMWDVTGAPRVAGHHSTDPRTAENALTAPARGAAARAWLRSPAASLPRTVIPLVGVGGRGPHTG
eukprot:gene12751-biopygen5413